MAEMIYEIPGFENGCVQRFGCDTEDRSLTVAAKLVSELLNKWNTNVAFFSLTGHGERMADLVKNESSFARLYTVDQKNRDIRVIIRKAKGLVNRKFVRAVIIEGMPFKEEMPWRWLEQVAVSKNISITFVGVVDESSFNSNE